MVSAHSDAKYTISTSDYKCIACEGEVACEAPYYSAVLFDEGDFRRRNYCLRCWKRNPGRRATETTAEETEETESRGPSDIFASWRTRRPAAPTERPKRVRFDPQLALKFFLRLDPLAPEELADELPADDELSDPAHGETEGAAEANGEHAREEERNHGDRPDTETDDAERADGRESEDSELAEDELAEDELAEDELAEDGAPRGAAVAAVDEEHAGTSSESERDQLRFFLALLLVRKKLLKFQSSIDRAGREFLLLADKEAHVHEVLNPGLSEGQIERLKDKLGELLQMQI